MANEEQLAILKQGVEVWNKWRGELRDLYLVTETTVGGTENQPDLWEYSAVVNGPMIIDLTRAELVHAALRNADLHYVDLTEANLVSAQLSEAALFISNLTRAKLIGADMYRTRLVKANLNGADLWRANLVEARLDGADLREARLQAADLREAYLPQSTLHKANLSDAKLYRTHLWQSDLTEANLTKAWLGSADLHESNLRGAVLTDASLYAANLTSADLTRADLSSADLAQANLTDANLKGANLRGANLNHAILKGANLDEAELAGVDLTEAIMLRTRIAQAKISESKIYGINVWDLVGEFEEQKNLVITAEGEPVITVDNLKVAQFIHLILRNAEIRDVINTLTSKSVLILGRFALPERKAILDSLRDELRHFDLLPIVFDFDRPTDKDFTETIKTLAGLSYFVIADVTNPKSSPLELQATVPDYQIPFVPIIQEGENPFAMMADLQKKYNWVLNTVSYDSEETLIKVLKPLIIDPAMKKRQELRIIKAQESEIISAKDFLAKGKS